MPVEVTTDNTTHYRLDLSELNAGDTLPGAIYTADGRPLIPANTVVDEKTLVQLKRHSFQGVYGTADWPESFHEICRSPQAKPVDDMPSQVIHRRTVPLPIDKLRVGQTLQNPLFNHAGVLLLAAGKEITTQFLHRLRQQGTFEVLVDSPEPQAARKRPVANKARLVRHLDNLIAHMGTMNLPQRPRTRPRPQLSLRNFRIEQERGRETYRQSVDQTANMMQDLKAGRCRSAASARHMIADYIEFLNLDRSLLPTIIKLQDKHNEYLFEHSVNVALLAMSASSELGLPSAEIVEIGLGALLQDVGMLTVPDDLRLARRWLTDEERQEIQRHPMYTLRHLEELDGLSQTNLLIPYQAHERMDTSGYPGGHDIGTTHPIARLVAIADVYAALCSSRPQRNAYGQYEAMQILLNDTHRGRFDSQAMRHFLDCVSLFPVGSYVRLNNGRAARVLRANPGQHTRPVVLLLDDDGRESDNELDLCLETNLFVAQALRDERDVMLDFGNR
jgi:HD-GYP domain-containing protein (c-di-GMP phosphodiesterase class II)